MLPEKGINAGPVPERDAAQTTPLPGNLVSTHTGLSYWQPNSSTVVAENMFTPQHRQWAKYVLVLAIVAHGYLAAHAIVEVRTGAAGTATTTATNGATETLARVRARCGSRACCFTANLATPVARSRQWNTSDKRRRAPCTGVGSEG